MKIDKNLVVIVTGGSSGLGLATVKLLTQLQAQVIICDINQQAGQKIAQKYKCDFVKLDVTDQNKVKEMFQYVIAKYKKVDAVLNSAGVFIPEFTLTHDKKVGSTEQFMKIIKINLIGTLNISKYAAKYMSTQPQVNGQRGVIINLSSILAEQGRVGNVSYSATKGAISAMTLPMARQLGKYKIRVMAIAPGFFDTPMNDIMSEQMKKKVIDLTVPLKKVGQPEWFAFCVRDIIQNPYASGSVWRLDGGIKVPNI